VGEVVALIEFDGVSKRYSGTASAAVDDLHLAIRAGEFLTLLGPSGSGKTTTLMLLAGFEAPTAGVIRLDGAPIQTLPPHRRNMGVVFQSYSLFPHMTVAQNVAFPLSVRGTAPAAAREKVAAALAKVHLQDYAGRKPEQLSGGQQQRVALARALVFEPRLVLMDEPLSALDKKLREEMQLEIRRLHRELGVTMVYVTHDQSEAMTLSDRVALFNHGRLEQIASPQVLYDAPANPFVASFLGDNNMVSGTRQMPARVRTRRGSVLTGRPGPLASAACAEGAAATLCVRPESLRICVNGALPDCENVLDATLVDAIHQGDHWRLVMDLNEGGDGAARENGELRDSQWFAKINPSALPPGLAPGQRLKLAFRADDAWVY
jgi:putative spermidine/putrescine transport system ATP-binding protein